MPCHLTEYSTIRDRILPGDIIAFSGHGLPSNVVKVATDSAISHVGIVLRSQFRDAELAHEMMEAMPIEGNFGVIIRDLRDRIAEQPKGYIWWLPLAKSVRRRLNVAAMQSFLLAQHGKAYDVIQALKAGLDSIEQIPILGSLVENPEDHTAWFCSELATAGLKAGGLLSHVNASETTPKDLCHFALFDVHYYQLQGEWCFEIDRYNSIRL